MTIKKSDLYSSPLEQLRCTSRRIWDSPEQLEAYGQRLMPLLAEAGLESGEPEVFRVHNIQRRWRRVPPRRRGESASDRLA